MPSKDAVTWLDMNGFMNAPSRWIPAPRGTVSRMILPRAVNACRGGTRGGQGLMISPWPVGSMRTSTSRSAANASNACFCSNEALWP